jgi:hypothetical protein
MPSRFRIGCRAKLAFNCASSEALACLGFSIAMLVILLPRKAPPRRLLLYFGFRCTHCAHPQPEALWVRGTPGDFSAGHRARTCQHRNISK